MSNAYSKIGAISGKIQKFRTSAPVDEEHKFKAMDLCKEMADILEEVHFSDRALMDSIRRWIGQIQYRYGLQHEYSEEAFNE